MSNLYLLATVLGAVGVTIEALSKNGPWAEILILFSGGLFGIGFLYQITPIVKHIWSSSAGKWLLGAVNLVVWFVAQVPARLSVAKALGLPPQDFEMTVSIWTVATFPAVWIALASFLVFSTYIAVALTCFMLHLSNFPLVTDAIDLCSRRLPEPVGNILTAKRRRDEAIRFLAHTVGSAMLAFASAALLHASFAFQEYCLPAIPWIAYISDYQEISAYPGIPKGQRVRLHENGVVSYASREVGGIRIHVVEFSTPR